MASSNRAAKFLGTLFTSFGRNFPRSTRIISVDYRHCFLAQSPRVLSPVGRLQPARNVSAIQAERQSSSHIRKDSGSGKIQNDLENSLILDEKEKRDTLVGKVKSAMSSDLSFSRIFAIVHIGGKQFKITSNDIIMIHKIAAKCGDKIRLRKETFSGLGSIGTSRQNIVALLFQILAVGGKEFSLLGKPLLCIDHVYVEATVLEKTRGRNVIVFKKKRRKNYKRWKEHRQDLTVLRINKIVINPDIIE